MLRPIYDWMMRLAASENAVVALACVAFIESSVFPIPPDLLLIPMVLAARQRAWRYAAIATLASVAGGFLGYAIGYYLFAALGRPILEFYGAMAHYQAMQTAYNHWGAWLIVIKGMTPIPYKVVTIASGAFHFPLATFAAASLVSRALRFFMVAALLYVFGDPVRSFIERRLTLVTSAFAVLLVGGFVAIAYL